MDEECPRVCTAPATTGTTAFQSTSSSSSSSAWPDHRQQLRDVLLRFPCATLEGVRSTALWRACCERFPAGASKQPPLLEELSTWLGDLAELQQDIDNGDGYWHLKASAALTPGIEGQLACWPLFLQCLGDIVRMHGSPQHAHALEVPHEEGASEEMVSQPLANVVGVLLSQLRPLLRRHWDASFDEKAAAFYSETGTFVTMKKMKHLVAEVLKWRTRRKVLQKAQGTWDAVDAALEAPIFLAVSQRHNDMVLCCPVTPLQLAVPSEQIPRAAQGRLECEAAQGQCDVKRPDSTVDDTESLDSSIRRLPLSDASTKSPHDSIKSWADISESERLHASTSSSPGDSDQSSWTGGIDKERWRLRIENAELKKRWRFEADRYKEEIRRLRIENAELKKRLFVTPDPSGHAAVNAMPPHLQAVHPIWVPAQTMLAPVVATPAGGEVNVGAETPVTAQWTAAHMAGMACGTSPSTPATMPSSGQVSPCQKGSLTPIHRFCYAVPLPQGLVSPCGQAIGPPWVAAVPFGMCTADASMSPFSDPARAEAMIPRSLFGSDPGSSQSRNSLASHSAVCTPSGHLTEIAATGQMKCSDDRWASIPSGIVERQKAQFETASGSTCEPLVDGVVTCVDVPAWQGQPDTLLPGCHPWSSAGFEGHTTS
mmetsp:Transcript_22760/g.51945  ORF Transcript_22760/g.51945 Transcript_22760/m.51945 type:complete len:655 (+) Transcript_22760:66-2030(+)